MGNLISPVTSIEVQPVLYRSQSTRVLFGSEPSQWDLSKRSQQVQNSAGCISRERQIANIQVMTEDRVTCFSYFVTIVCIYLNLNRCFMCHAHWQSCWLSVCSNQLVYDRGAHSGFITVVTLVARKKSKSTKNTLLFVGSSDAGKTSILSSVSPQLAIHPPEG